MIAKIMPNQVPSHKTPDQAWQYAKMLIESHGDQVKTEDGKLTREVCNLHLCILEPLTGWPIEGSGWNMEGLEKYAEQLLSGDNPSGFAYTYGERLTRYPDSIDDLFLMRDIYDPKKHIDQMAEIITRLKGNHASRRAVASTWIPYFDPYNSEVPCLQLLDFLIRDGKLNLTAFFRSHDIERAWVPNVYGLGQLMKHVACEVGVPVGSLTTISASAHIYEA
jgi:thymidylate synthase